MDIINRKHIPNIITVIRFILIIPLVVVLLKQEYRIAFYIFFIAAWSDGLDGLLARHFHWTSRFGAIADPIADKLLMFVIYISLAWLQKLPVWFVALVIFRDLVIVGGAFAYNYFIEKPKFSATMLSKINTSFQLLLVATIIFSSGFIAIPRYAIHTLMLIVFFTTVGSLIEYVWIWGRSACIKSRSSKLTKRNSNEQC